MHDARHATHALHGADGSSDPGLWVVAELGISTGTTETTYNPSGPVQRDQLASFPMRTLDLIQPEGGGDALF